MIISFIKKLHLRTSKTPVLEKKAVVITQKEKTLRGLYQDYKAQMESHENECCKDFHHMQRGWFERKKESP